MLSYEISDYCDPVKTVGKGPLRSVFREKIEGLPVGKAVIVTGMTNVSTRARQIGLQMEPKRKFSTGSLGDGRFQITRVS